MGLNQMRNRVLAVYLSHCDENGKQNAIMTRYEKFNQETS